MPKLRISDDELDIDELEDAEYSEDDYVSYSGEQPPADTVLDGYIKSAWWTETSGGDRMIKLIFIADGNTGEEEEYDGLPVWENLPLTSNAKFRWKPFIDSQGITLLDIKKKLYVSPDDDNIGAPIEKIGTWEPGEDTRARIITKVDRYDGKASTKVRKWLDPEEVLDDEEEELEDEEPEEEAPPPRRTRTAARPARGTERAATPAKSARTAKAPTRGGKAATRPARRSRREAGYDEEPPF